MPTILYSSADAGAPVQDYFNLSEPKGKLREIWKAVLIDGYGTRTPVGHWTIAFDDPANNKIVFRHKSGNHFLRVNDNIGSCITRVRGYTSMTDIDTGEGEYPSFDDVPPGSASTLSRFDNVTLASRNEWTMIADADGDFFYWFPRTTSVVDLAGYFYGKITTFADNQTRDVFVNAINSNGTEIISITDYLLSSASNQNSDYGLSVSNINQPSARCGNIPDLYPLFPASTIGAPRYLTRHYIKDSNNLLVGYLPEIFRVTMRVSPNDTGIPDADRQTIQTMNGINYFVFVQDNRYFLLRADVSTG